MAIVSIKIPIARDRARALYRAVEDGEEVYADITADQYAALALPKPKHLNQEDAHEPDPRPDLPKGKTWVFISAGGGMLKFDTPDGELQPGDFFPGEPGRMPLYCEPDGKLTVPELFDLQGKDLTVTREKVWRK